MPRPITPSVLAAAQRVIAQSGASGAVCPPREVRKVLTGLPYYSTGELTATIAAGVATCQRGTNLRLFAYGIGESMLTAGIASPDRATEVHTNLTNASQTNAGENLRIVGVALQVVGAGVISDAKFAVAALPELVASLELVGDKGRWLLGPADIIPGGPGFYGAAMSAADGANISALTQSMPGPGAFFRIPGGIDWTSAGPDSRLALVLNNPNDISFAALAASPPASVKLRLRASFVSVAISDPSVNT